MKILVRMGFVALVLTVTFQGCRQAEKVHPKKGKFTLALISRPHAWSSETSFRAAPGTLEAQYSGNESEVEASQTLTRTFVGGFSIPVQLGNQGIPMELDELKIQGEGEKTLLKIDDTMMPSLVQQAGYSAMLMTVLITEDGGALPRIQFKRVPPQAYFPYALLKQAFPDPVSIASAPDLEGTLAKLREIATPTQEYHEALLRIVTEAPSLDLAHLHLILDACYVNAAQVDTARVELARTDEEMVFPEDAPASAGEAGRAVAEEEAENEEYRQAHEKLVHESQPLQPYVNRIILVGLSKATDLKSYDQAYALLSKLFPAQSHDRVFRLAKKRLGEVSQEQEDELKALAKAKESSN